MKKLARVDFKSSCSAYPSRSVLEVIERYEGPTLLIKALLLIINSESPLLLPTLTHIFGIPQYKTSTGKYKKKNRAIALSKRVSPLLYGSPLLVYFCSCVYRYRPILSQLNEGEYLFFSFQHERLTP